MRNECSNFIKDKENDKNKEKEKEKNIKGHIGEC